MASVFLQQGRTFLLVESENSQDVFEIIALSPINEKDGKQIEHALEKYTVFDKQTKTTLYPYVKVDSGDLVVPGDEARHHVSPNVTYAIACFVAGKPFTDYLPEKEQGEEEEEGDGEEEVEEEQDEEEQGDDEAEEAEEEEISEETKTIYKKEAKLHIQRARDAFNARSQGRNAPPPPKTWDDVRKRKEAEQKAGIVATEDEESDDVSWSKIRESVETHKQKIMQQGGENGDKKKKKKKHESSGSKSSDEASSSDSGSSSSSNFEGTKKKKKNGDNFDDMPALEDTNGETEQETPKRRGYDYEAAPVLRKNERNSATTPSNGTKVSIPKTAYQAKNPVGEVGGAVSAALSRQTQKFNNAAKHRVPQQDEKKQQIQNKKDDFVGGYGQASNMPSGVPVINININDEDEDIDDSESSGPLLDEERPLNGFLSAKPHAELLTEAKGEIKDMSDYRKRLAAARSNDTLGKNVCNFLEETGNATVQTKPDENIVNHPARKALPDVKGLMGNNDSAFNSTVNIEQLREEDCTVFMPTNLDVDPKTGRIARRLDDNLLGLSAKEAKAVQKRRRQKAALGIDPVDYSRRTITSILKGDAKKEIARKQAIIEHLKANPEAPADAFEIEFINDYLVGEGRKCPNQQCWDIILHYVRENSTQTTDEEGYQVINRPMMLPLEEYEMMAKGQQSPFSAQKVLATAQAVPAQSLPTPATQPAKAQPQLTSQTTPNAMQMMAQQFAADANKPKETPEQATARLAKEMKQFGMNPSLIQSALQTSKYNDSTGGEEIENDFPQSIDEIAHLAKPFQSKKAKDAEKKEELTKKETSSNNTVPSQPPVATQPAMPPQPLVPTTQPAVPSQTPVATQPFAVSPPQPAVPPTTALTVYAPQATSSAVSSVSQSNNPMLNDLFEMHVLLSKQFSAFSMQLSEMSRLNQRLTQMMISQMK